MEQIIARAKSCKQRIVLPESLEERTLTAADKALADDLADIILIGAQGEIFALADKLGLKNIGKATIIDPTTSERTETYVQLLYNLRKNKGMTEEEARKKVLDPLYYGCLIIKNGDADGQISGALSTTGDTLRPALQIIKCAPGVSCVSGAMLMITPAKQYGEDGVLVMGDVAVILRLVAELHVRVGNVLDALDEVVPVLVRPPFARRVYVVVVGHRLQPVEDRLREEQALVLVVDVLGEYPGDGHELVYCRTRRERYLGGAARAEHADYPL